MLFKDLPIQRKLITVILFTSGAVLLLTCMAFFIYEYNSSRNNIKNQLFITGNIIASNSTAAIAFNNPEDAHEILSALKAEQHVIAAVLYDENGNVFSKYPGSLMIDSTLPVDSNGYRFVKSQLEIFVPVTQGSRQLGILYLKSDLGALYERFQIYGLVVAFVLGISFLLAYALSLILQKGISKPILALAETAKAVSKHQDYSRRAPKTGNDELGLLTEAFNQMLVRIQEQNESLNEFNQQLGQKVKERTLEPEAANKELESFSYSVSHDLRAPLRAINGFTQILEKKYNNVIDDEGRRLMGIVSDNAKKMGQLIDDLLQFSRLGKKDVQKINIDTNAMLTSLLKEIDKAQWNSKATIVTKDLLPAYGDGPLIHQVFYNLITNALKYSRTKPNPVAEIGSYSDENENIYYVKDNGVGFDMEYYDKLFHVFQRLHSAEEFEGTGVGLAIVSKIVSRHGGKVWAEGKVNEGAVFYFSLPKSL
jgi:signal transduction histidine kinase